MVSRVKWKGLTSQNFQIKQGVRHRGGLMMSTDMYKDHIDPLLYDLGDSKLGIQIQTIATDAGSPTCADDVSLLTVSRLNLQLMLNYEYEYAKMIMGSIFHNFLSNF